MLFFHSPASGRGVGSSRAVRQAIQRRSETVPNRTPPDSHQWLLVLGSDQPSAGAPWPVSRNWALFRLGRSAPKVVGFVGGGFAPRGPVA